MPNIFKYFRSHAIGLNASRTLISLKETSFSLLSFVFKCRLVFKLLVTEISICHKLGFSHKLLHAGKPSEERANEQNSRQILLFDKQDGVRLETGMILLYFNPLFPSILTQTCPYTIFYAFYIILFI